MTDNAPKKLVSICVRNSPLRRVLDGADNAVTGVVDEHVYATEPPDCGLDRLNCIERVGDIKLMREKPLR
jgi:hypothetical protein